MKCSVVVVTTCRHEEYRKYRKQSSLKRFDYEEQQQRVTSFFGSTSATTYSSSHSQQRAVTAALIQDLIIRCSLPLCIVENTHFRFFLSSVDSRYVPPARSTVTSLLTTSAENMQQLIIKQLANVNSISTTLDIWSDRRMRSYLGITCHYHVAEGS
jgi:hypothetical protein